MVSETVRRSILVLYHLLKNSGNFGWEFLFGKNGTCHLPFA